MTRASFTVHFLACWLQCTSTASGWFCFCHSSSFTGFVSGFSLRLIKINHAVIFSKKIQFIIYCSFDNISFIRYHMSLNLLIIYNSWIDKILKLKAELNTLDGQVHRNKHSRTTKCASRVEFWLREEQECWTWSTPKEKVPISVRLGERYSTSWK